MRCAWWAQRTTPPRCVLTTLLLDPTTLLLLQETVGPEGSYALPPSYQPPTPPRAGPLEASPPSPRQDGFNLNSAVLCPITISTDA